MSTATASVVDTNAAAPIPPAAPRAAGPAARAIAAPILPGLGTGTARVAAAAAATAAAVLTAWLLGGGIRTPELVTLTLGPLVLFVAIAFGLGVSAISITALLSGVLVAVLVVAAVDVRNVDLVAAFSVCVTAAAVGGLIAVIWTLGPDTRGIGGGAIIGIPVMVVAATWPVIVGVGTYRLIGDGFRLPLIAAVATALATWAASSAGRAMGLEIAALFGGLRDAVFRVITVTSGILASLWAGAAVESRVVLFTTGTRVESLATTAGWTFAAGLFAALVWMALALPRWLVRAQLRGRIDAVAVGEPLLFLTCASCSALALWRIDPGIALGRACCVALAGGCAYAYVRVRYAAPLPSPNVPLWLVVPVAPKDAMLGAAGDVAGAWRGGQVTVLATPSAASTIGGEHLYAADHAGLGTALFPLRLVHLEDWDDAQPALWPALPIRELYAPPALWSKILAERVDASAHVLVLLPETLPVVVPRTSADDEPPSSPIARILRLSRRFADAWQRNRPPSDRVLGAFVPRSNSPAIRSDLTQPDVERLTSDIVVGKEALVSRVREVRPAAEPIVVRHVIVQCAPEDAQLADDLVRRIHGARDPAGRLVESWVSTRESGNSALQRIVSMPIGIWRHASLLVATLLYHAAEDRVVRRQLFGVAAFLLERDWKGEFELVVIESGTGVKVPGLPSHLVTLGIGKGVIARIVSVRSQAAEASASLTYPSELYSGQIRVPAGRSRDVAAEQLADKLLALDLLNVEKGGTSRQAPPPPPNRKLKDIVEMVFAMGILALGVAVMLGDWGWMRQPSSVPIASPPTTMAMPSVLQQAFQMRQSGDVQGAISTLTAAIDAEPNAGIRAQMLRDRAYCYKLQQQWPASIRDLTQVLTLEPESGRTVLKDRAFAYMKVNDLDAAIADFDAAASASPGDADARGGANLLRTILRPTAGGIVFAFLPVGRSNGPAYLPPETRNLGYPLNLRFWWHPIPANEVRYTKPDDLKQAMDIVYRLRANGLAIGDPVLMGQNIPRDRRIELWLTTRSDTRASAR